MGSSSKGDSDCGGIIGDNAGAADKTTATKFAEFYELLWATHHHIPTKFLARAMFRFENAERR
jgi:hypothetical protein